MIRIFGNLFERAIGEANLNPSTSEHGCLRVGLCILRSNPQLAMTVDELRCFVDKVLRTMLGRYERCLHDHFAKRQSNGRQRYEIYALTSQFISINPGEQMGKAEAK